MSRNSRDFGDLSLRGQVGRLRKLGELALVRFGIEGARLKLINPIQNTTFRVDADTGERYCLHIHKPDADELEIWAELAWLSAVRDGTGLRLPDPVRALDGNLLAVVGTGGVPEPRCCALFRWIEGRAVGNERATPGMFERVGATMARLHNFAGGWNPPVGFARYRVDHELVSEVVRDALASPASYDLFGAPDRRLIESSASRVSGAMKTLGYSRDVFGLVHSDLVPHNLLSLRGELAVLDFDDCCWGHYLYDMAFPLREVEDREDYEHLRAAFLTGYRGIRSLPQEQEVYLGAFLAAAHLLRMLWVTQKAEGAAYRGWADGFVARSLRKLWEFQEVARFPRG